MDVYHRRQMAQSQRPFTAVVMANVRQQQMERIAYAIMDLRDRIANTVSDRHKHMDWFSLHRLCYTYFIICVYLSFFLFRFE